MQNSELLKYGRYLTSLIASVILETNVPEPFEDIDWAKLFSFAKKHDVATVIYPAVKNMDIPEDVLKLFKNHQNRIMARTARQAIEADRVLGEFEKNDIRYIRLKGIHIKDLYPAQYMRGFTDVDIFVSEADRIKSMPIMYALGYDLEDSIQYHDEYRKDDFFIYEIHNPMFSESHNYKDIFNDTFSKSETTTDNKYSYTLKPEYFYLHLLFHLYGHFVYIGCGIRLFTDLLVFGKSFTDVDFGFIEATLKEYEMYDFYISVQKLMGFFFFDKKANGNTLKIASYIFANDAIERSRKDLANVSFGYRVLYFIKGLFPPLESMKSKYPVLNKAPVLLPVCWLRRIFHSLFFNRKAIKQQIIENKTLNSKEFRDIKKARKLATKNK